MTAHQNASGIDLKLVSGRSLSAKKTALENTTTPANTNNTVHRRPRCHCATICSDASPPLHRHLWTRTSFKAGSYSLTFILPLSLSYMTIIQLLSVLICSVDVVVIVFIPSAASMRYFYFYNLSFSLHPL